MSNPEAGAVTQPGARRRDPADRLGLVTAVLLAIAAYAASIGHDFVYDDVHVIVDNWLLHSLGNWRAILGSAWWGTEMYRPLTMLTFAFDWSVGGGSPLVFHVVNVLLHAVVTALVFLVARKYLPTFGATVAALAFAVHPVHVEAVASVVGRAEVLAALFVLGAALAYSSDGRLAAAGDVTWRRWLSSFGCLALLGLALGSKEMAFATPGIFLIVDWLDAKQSGARPADRFTRHWVLWASSVLLTAAFLWLRSTVVGGLAGVHAAPGIEGEGVGTRALVMAPVALEYVRLFVFPLRLSADYSPDFLKPVARITLTGFAGFATVLLAVLVAVQNRDRAPVVSFGLAWIGGTLLIIANVLVPTGLLLAERSLYLPSVGAVLLAGWAAGWLAVRRKAVAVAVVALVVAAGLARTILRVQVWRSPGPFLAQLVRDAPGSYRSLWFAGLLAYETGNRERGEELVWRALEIQPAFPNLWQDVARRYVEEERWLEAAHAFRAEFRLDSTRQLVAAEAIVNYVRAGELDSAAAVGERARGLDPTDYRVMIAMSDIALARGRPLEAMTLRRQVAWQFPGVWQYWHLTADAALEAGHCPEVERSMARIAALHGEGEPLPSLAERAELARCEVGG